MSDLERFVRERAAGYGALRRSAPTAIALDRAADRLRQYRERIAELEAELARRDQNETRHCLNWGPCSRMDFPVGADELPTLKETTDVD